MRCSKSIKECLSGKGKTALQAEKAEQSPLYSALIIPRKVFLWILKENRKFQRKASLTVEAAVVLPVFILTVSSILGILDIYRMQALIKTSLHQSAMELGMYAYAGNKSPVGQGMSSAVCMAYAQSKMPDLGEHVKLSYWGSVCGEDEILLRAQAEYRLPVSMTTLWPVQFFNEVKVKIWVGWDGEKETSGKKFSGEEMVYISDNESVYHTSSSCTHIELSVHTALAGNMDRYRNQYGEKYHPCEKCGNSSGTGVVYYTEKGNRYHTSEHCSGLKRAVYLVRKAEMSHLRECERCRKEGQT